MVTLTMAKDAPSIEGPTIPEGVTVQYLGHVIGGMVRVKYKGQECVIHPLNTKELSQ